MADFNGLTKEQEDELIEKIMQDKPWEGFFNRAWHRFFRNHLLKITLLFYIPVMNKIIPEYSTIIMGILFILAMATEYRTKRIEDKITDRQWVEVAIRGGVIGNPPEYKYLPAGKQKIVEFFNHHKWIIVANIAMFSTFLILQYFLENEQENNYKKIVIISHVFLNFFYVSFLGLHSIFTGKEYDVYFIPGIATHVGYINNDSFLDIFFSYTMKLIFYFFSIAIFLFFPYDYIEKIGYQDTGFLSLIGCVFTQLIIFVHYKNTFIDSNIINISWRAYPTSNNS